MAFGNIRPFQRNGIQNAVVFGRNGNIPSCNEPFGILLRLVVQVSGQILLRLVTQGSDQVMLRHGKRCVHLLNLCPLCRKFPGRNDGIFRFYPVLLFRRFIFKSLRIRIGRSNGCADAIIPQHRHAVHIQLVQRQSGSHRNVGPGAPDSQTAHDIVHDIVVVRSHSHAVGCGNLRFVIHQYQAVAAAGLYVNRTGKVVCPGFACAEDQRLLGRIAVGVDGYRAAFRYVTVTAVCFNCPVLCVQDYIFSCQDNSVAGKLLHGNTGAYAIPVGNRIAEELSSGPGNTGKVGHGLGVHRDILSRIHGNAFAQGNYGLSGQAPHVHRSRQIHVGITALVTVYRIAADIMTCIGRRAYIIQQRIHRCFERTANFIIVPPLRKYKIGKAVIHKGIK